MERRDSECGARFDDVGFRRGIRPQCFHREPTEPGDAQSKVACFNEPITSVEHAKINHGDHDHHKVRVLFQSTSSRNVRCVNSLDENMLFARKKSCAMGDRKRMWVMDTSAKRQPLMRKRHLYAMSWNYWHGPKPRIDALAPVVAQRLRRSGNGENGAGFLPHGKRRKCAGPCCQKVK